MNSNPTECYGKLRMFADSLFAVFTSNPISIVIAFIAFLKGVGDIVGFIFLGACSFIFGDCDFWTCFSKEKTTYWKGRVCWITGASDGIGKELATQLALRECFLILTSRSQERLKETQQEILTICKEKGVKMVAKDFLILPCDISDTPALDEAINCAISWKKEISFVFNNAGVSNRGCFLDAETEQKVVAIDLLGPMRLTNKIIPIMRKNGFGHIIFTNSLSGRIWSGGRTSYCTAKAGLLAYASSLRRECIGNKLNVAVSSMMIGYVNTDISSRALGPSGAATGSDSSVVSPTHQKGLSTERCVNLMLRGASNKIEECWIAKQPFLTFLYLLHFIPYAGNLILDGLAPRQCEQSDIDAKKLYEKS